MDKRYQVFVSSTFEDLQEERKEVMQALLELDCIPAGMELFPASNDDQWTLIKRVIDDCDYYLLIIGGRYGSENDKGISYTQMEFEYALSQGKPIISFLPKHPENIPTKHTDNNPEKQKKLETFKVLAKKKLVRFWETPSELGGIVSRSMVKLIKEFPTEGWIKSGNAVDENSLQEILRLQKENKELQEKLKTISTEAPKGTEIFSQGEDLVAIGVMFTADQNGEAYDCKAKLDFTWNQIFACVAPQMIDECEEGIFKERLISLLKNKAHLLKSMESFKNMKRFRHLDITQESLNLVKVQFKALGLIQLSEKKRNVRNLNTYWTLTPYGDYVMTQLLAVKRKIQNDQL